MSESLTPEDGPTDLKAKDDSPDPEAAADPQEVKTRAEITKLDLEAKKIELEIKHLSRPPIRHPSAYIPILTSLMALLGVGANLWVTTQRKNEAESETKQQASYATSLKRELQRADVSPSKTVSIRFRGSLSREDITALQQGLIASGFVASPPLRTPEVTQSGVTYYHPDDRALAEDVLNQATAFFNQRGCPLRLQLISQPDQAANNRPGTILLDIYHSC